jgi:hypothetical protein
MKSEIENQSAPHGGNLLANDERRHPYQRGRASITGARLRPEKIIGTGRLVGVALARLVLLVVDDGSVVERYRHESAPVIQCAFKRH